MTDAAKEAAPQEDTVVIYFEAKLPWEIPEWMPKTKDKAKAVINEFVSVLLQQDFKASFDEIL